MIIVSHRTYLELLGKQFRVSEYEKGADKTIFRYRKLECLIPSLVKAYLGVNFKSDFPRLNRKVLF